MDNKITIALSKGRILKEALPLFEKLGISTREVPDSTRKLILDTNKEEFQFIIVRPADVPIYVHYGAADLGIAGKDILMEYNGGGLYEPLDLRIAECSMMLAGIRGQTNKFDRPRIATKYTQTTRNYFTMQGKQVEIIKLYGSMELAPVLGLADQIVDLIDTGNTLKANGLEKLEVIADISARLIINKAAMKIKPQLIKPIITRLGEITGQP